jgi:hypothetical protein
VPISLVPAKSQAKLNERRTTSDGRRWIASSELSGNYKVYGFDIERSQKSMRWGEHENAYTDSLGPHQADGDFATGRASGGVKRTYPFACAAGA